MFFSKKVSLLTSMVVGTVTAIVAFIGIIFADELAASLRGYYGPPRDVEAIAVGNGYSIALVAYHTHPYLAEYDQFVRVYKNTTPREGEYLGELKVETNTGGRVRIGIFLPADMTKKEVLLLQRYGLTRVHLENQETEYEGSWKPDFSEDDLPHNEQFIFFGWISGASFPIKFIPCQVWPRLSKAEREAIVGTDGELDRLCTDALSLQDIGVSW